MKHFGYLICLAAVLAVTTTTHASEKGSMKGSEMKGSPVEKVMAPAMTKKYAIDVAHSTMGFAIKHLGIGVTRGSFGVFEGNITMDPNDFGSFEAIATIEASSIDTKNNDRDKHLRGTDFFDVEAYPEITFHGTSLEKKGNGAVISGKLTMKGVTRQVSIPVEVSGPVNSPFGGSVIAVRGQFQLNRQDYNINWSKTMDTGGLVVADLVDIIIEIEAHHKG